jgi:exosome complex component RRP42
MTPEMKADMIKTLDKGLRYDGRKFNEYRDIVVKSGAVNTAEGSAEVWFGDTHIIAGVKTELGTPYPDSPDEGSIMIGAEFTPMANPDFEPGPPSIESIELARVVDRGIRESHAIDFKKLCITPGELAWIVIVDICIINDGGNLQDAAALAAITAFKDAKFPTRDGRSIDYKHLTEESIPVSKDPVEVTVHKIGPHLIVDPTSEEEKATDARLTVAIMDDGNLCALQKGGDSPLMYEDIKAMVEIAAGLAPALRGKIGGN